MKIQFTSSAIREYAQGNFHVVNDGKPFEVATLLGSELLHAEHFLEDKFVKVFEPAANQKPAESVEGYPDDFPSADVLAREGFKHEEVLLLDRDQLIEIKGIGPKTADAILEFTAN